MNGLCLKSTISLIVVGAFLGIAHPANAQDLYGPSGQQLEFPLFTNFATPPGASGMSAAMYPAPHPVPYWVGGTLYTYQPFYPHQHLYWHKKNYYNYYGTSAQFYSDNQRHGAGGDALNQTTVIWKGTGYHMGNLPFSSYRVQKASYNFQARRYGLSSEAGLGGGRIGRGGYAYGGGFPSGTCQ